jgi:hypothetical protein
LLANRDEKPWSHRFKTQKHQINPAILLNFARGSSGCTVKNFSKSNPASYGIKLEQSGICSGNVIINCYVGLYVNKSGSIIGNTVITNSSQYGIYLYGVADDYVMLDQNTVMGPGARFYNAANGVSYLKGTNAGF